MFLDYRKEPECVDESKKRNSMRSADKSGSEHTKERTELIISNLWKVSERKDRINNFNPCLSFVFACDILSYLIFKIQFNIYRSTHN